MDTSTLFFITANDCGACNQYKKKSLSQLKTLINNNQNVNLEHINLLKMGNKIPTRYSTQFNTMIRWYPFFILQIGSGFISFDPDTDGSFDPQSIIRWINKKIKANIKAKFIKPITAPEPVLNESKSENDNSSLCKKRFRSVSYKRKTGF